MIIQKGSKFGEQFIIESVFNGGGMGIVYKARHDIWNIDVAIKHPRDKFLKTEKQIEEFELECATWSSIGLDPYIATCFYSRVITGLPCVVSEFLAGGSLQDAIAEKKLYRGEENQVLSSMLSIAASTAWGLKRAHESRLLHCDVKPGNMLLTEYGTAKIADFGLAVAFKPTQSDSIAKGLTVAFSSPEQLRGNPLTPAADVWSWGASMLALFAGGVDWQNGAACGAVLRGFLADGGKSYRIPAMPESFADLLSDCFKFNADERISDFEKIAKIVCEIHEQIVGYPCPAQQPDLELVSADSFNNRAVSRFDLSDITGVNRLLRESLSVDPLHPEANFNSAIIAIKHEGLYPKLYAERLLESTKYDLGEYRAWLYLACLSLNDGQSNTAHQYFAKAQEIGGAQSHREIQRIWRNAQNGSLNLVLAPPISGEDLALDSERFNRLIDKAELAMSENRIADANRYVLMSGDIPGFARHPKRLRFLTNILL